MLLSFSASSPPFDPAGAVERVEIPVIHTVSVVDATSIKRGFFFNLVVVEERLIYW